MNLTALVTGATSGIGEAIARRLLRDGHRVIVAGRRSEKLNDLGKQFGDVVLPLVLDVTDSAAVGALPASLPSEWQKVGLLINNAGLALGVNPAYEANLPDWDTMVATNINGLLHLTRAFLPGMVERQLGHVVNISSTAASFPYAGSTVYGASKAFVTHFSACLQADMLGTGVRVTDIEPGMVGGSEFSDVRLGGDADKVAAIYEGTTPLSPDDVAEAVAWAISLPVNVNVSRIELMPSCQAAGPSIIKRLEL